MGSCVTRFLSNEKLTDLEKYPDFSWDYVPQYMHVWKKTSYTNEELKYIAKFPLITFEKAQGTAEGSVQQGTLKAARAVKKIYPDTKILYYKNIIIDWHGSSMTKELISMDNAYLKSIDGSYPVVNKNSQRKFFDISLPQVKDWWMRDAARMLSNSSIDGLFIDANIKVLTASYFAHGKKVGEVKAQKLRAGYHDLLKKINNRFSADNLVIGNIIRARMDNSGLEYLNYFDGSYLENFEHNVNGVLREDYIAKGIASVQQAARKGKIIAFTAGLGKALDIDSSGIGLDEARKGIKNLDAVADRLNYLTAMFLIMAEKYSYFFPHDSGYGVSTNSRNAQVNRTWMYNLPIFKKKLGKPKGPAIRQGYTYTREFEYCSVYLDIENETAQLKWSEAPK